MASWDVDPLIVLSLDVHEWASHASHIAKVAKDQNAESCELQSGDGHLPRAEDVTTPAEWGGREGRCWGRKFPAEDDRGGRDQ